MFLPIGPMSSPDRHIQELLRDHIGDNHIVYHRVETVHSPYRYSILSPPFVGGVLIAHLAHHPSRKGVFEHALIGFVNIKTSDAFHIGTDNKRGGGSSGHHIGVISSRGTSGDQASIIVHQ